MFDGTDLSIAFGSSFGQAAMAGPGPMGGHAPSMEPMQQVRSAAPPPAPASHPAATSHTMPPDVSYGPPEAMYAKQAPVEMPADGIWDKLAARKGEVMKFFMLALVVLLGVSMDRMGSHYINGYISRSLLGDTQEFLVRLAYPLGVLLFMWILRATS